MAFTGCRNTQQTQDSPNYSANHSPNWLAGLLTGPLRNPSGMSLEKPVFLSRLTNIITLELLAPTEGRWPAATLLYRRENRRRPLCSAQCAGPKGNPPAEYYMWRTHAQWVSKVSIILWPNSTWSALVSTLATSIYVALEVGIGVSKQQVWLIIWGLISVYKCVEM